MNHLAGWIAFIAVVSVLLALDLGVFHKKAHAVAPREALRWTAVWVGLALAFDAGVYLSMGGQAGTEFLTAYLMEESLSVDNIFVIYLVFRFFQVKPEHQHRVLFWGILGAFVMRLAFIVAGIALIHRFHWVVYVFGAVLVWSGLRMAIGKEPEVHPEQNRVLLLVRRFVPMTRDYSGARFFTRIDGKVFATPLLAVLVIVESTDLIFAVDSIPAVLAITQDPFLAFTSNVFAILGLRSLYFAVAGLVETFHRLHVGLAVVLVFVGAKMILSDTVHVPTLVSLAVIIMSVGLAIAASLVWPASAEKGTGSETESHGP